MTHPDCQRLLMFVHIPKAAGMTLHRIIARQYPKNAVFFIDGQRVQQDALRFLSMTPAERARYCGLVGHVPYGLHEFVERPMDYITILRDPVDRLISHYYYAKSTPTNLQYEWIKSENATVERYLQERIPPNGQATMVCGFTKEQPLRQDDPNTDVLALAKDNLRRNFAAFGLSEHFDETILLFQKKLGWKNPFYVTINVTKQRPARDAVPPETRRAIEQHSPLDVELYEYARTLYAEEVAKAGITAADLDAYARGNQRFQTVENARVALKQTAKRLLGRT